MKIVTLQLLIRSIKGIIAALEMEHKLKQDEVARMDFGKKEDINQQSD
jgi:hypothetical protein